MSTLPLLFNIYPELITVLDYW